MALIADQSIRASAFITLSDNTNFFILGKNKFNLLVKSNPNIPFEMRKYICEHGHNNLRVFKGHLNNAFHSIVNALRSFINSREPETGKRIDQVSTFTRELAQFSKGKQGNVYG